MSLQFTAPTSAGRLTAVGGKAEAELAGMRAEIGKARIKVAPSFAAMAFVRPT